MSNITTKDQERIQNYIDQNLIRFNGVITDPNQIRRTAKKLGLRGLVTEAHERIHGHVDEKPDDIHLVTTKSVANGRGFLVGMLYAGLFEPLACDPLPFCSVLTFSAFSLLVP